MFQLSLCHYHNKILLKDFIIGLKNASYLKIFGTYISISGCIQFLVLSERIIIPIATADRLVFQKLFTEEVFNQTIEAPGLSTFQLEVMNNQHSKNYFLLFSDIHKKCQMTMPQIKLEMLYQNIRHRQSLIYFLSLKTSFAVHIYKNLILEIPQCNY